MKNISILIILSSIMLFSCGGSGGDSNAVSETSKSDFIEKLSNTSWEKECSIYNKFASEDAKELWNVKTKLSIDASLQATYRTQYFHPTDTKCDSAMFDTLDISKFEFTSKIISEESIAATGLNERFIFNSNNRDLATNYTIIYIDSEKLYFGQNSGVNLGKTPQTRHSSISLDESFIQIIN